MNAKFSRRLKISLGAVTSGMIDKLQGDSGTLLESKVPLSEKTADRTVQG
jgi:hypothetical protein